MRKRPFVVDEANPKRFCAVPDTTAVVGRSLLSRVQCETFDNRPDGRMLYQSHALARITNELAELCRTILSYHV